MNLDNMNSSYTQNNVGCIHSPMPWMPVSQSREMLHPDICSNKPNYILVKSIDEPIHILRLKQKDIIWHRSLANIFLNIRCCIFILKGHIYDDIVLTSGSNVYQLHWTDDVIKTSAELLWNPVALRVLTHWGRDKMDAISQTTFQLHCLEGKCLNSG